jgi:hypothetical protein
LILSKINLHFDGLSEWRSGEDAAIIIAGTCNPQRGGPRRGGSAKRASRGGKHRPRVRGRRGRSARRRRLPAARGSVWGGHASGRRRLRFAGGREERPTRMRPEAGHRLIFMARLGAVFDPKNLAIGGLKSSGARRRIEGVRD